MVINTLPFISDVLLFVHKQKYFQIWYPYDNAIILRKNVCLHVMCMLLSYFYPGRIATMVVLTNNLIQLEMHAIITNSRMRNIEYFFENLCILAGLFDLNVFSFYILYKCARCIIVIPRTSYLWNYLANCFLAVRLASSLFASIHGSEIAIQRVLHSIVYGSTMLWMVSLSMLDNCNKKEQKQCMSKG